MKTQASFLPAAPDRASEYTAHHIEVLEGLEPVRRRPGMYIGGTDSRALHHLFAEILDNAMDEAIAGFARRIEVRLEADGVCEVSDDGRGIPVDSHPKFPDCSALEVIMTTLHAGGKFSGSVYRTAGGLHGVGAAVVNALSEQMQVEVVRDRKLYRQEFRRGKAQGGLQELGSAPRNRRGSRVRFRPDSEIFGERRFSASRILQMARSKAYLHRGVTIDWSHNFPASEVPKRVVLHYPDGLASMLREQVEGRNLVCPDLFHGRVEAGEDAVCEWSVGWSVDGFSDGRDSILSSYCNTIPTPEGGTHETGLRLALCRGLKAHAERTGVKGSDRLQAEDVLGTACALLSVFIREPEFVGQTKDRLSTSSASRLVEKSVGDHFDHWLAASPVQAERLLEWTIERSRERHRLRREKEVARQGAVRRLRLPGKLADCSGMSAEGSEIFLVEGDSAGGSAKQARDRATQAILPLRGKILNVASAGQEKLASNQELSDLSQALGCGLGSCFRPEDLRYERVIIMTDADVDGAHIASLLITFFFYQMPGLIEAGRLFLAQPPLYRLSSGDMSVYARDDEHRDELLGGYFSGRKNVEISRFKGLGEMMSAQLKTTTMSRETRTLARVCLSEGKEAAQKLVDILMGKKSDSRFRYIQENARWYISEGAQFRGEIDI